MLSAGAVRGFEDSEDIRIVLIVEGIEDILLPLEVTRIVEPLDAEVLRPGEVFEVDAPDARDVATFSWWDITGVGQWRFEPRVEAVVTRRDDDEAIGRAGEQFGRDSGEVLIDAWRDDEKIAVVIDC